MNVTNKKEIVSTLPSDKHALPNSEQLKLAQRVEKGVAQSRSGTNAFHTAQAGKITNFGIQPCTVSKVSKPKEYSTVVARIIEDKIVFDSEEAFKEATQTGFFRVKTPEKINLEAGREFAKKFIDDPNYKKVGELNVAEGYLTSAENQTVRFTLEKGNWSKYYPQEIQNLGKQLNAIGMMALKTCFEKIGIPEKDWDQASSGSLFNRGSHFLLFNCYDPKNASEGKPGVVAHKDWSYVIVLDAAEPGLEVEINGKFVPLRLEEGYLTINFGRPLEMLTKDTAFPVTASTHRVVSQTKKTRTSTVVFVDPNLKGNVWKYAEGKLHSSMTTEAFFRKCSQEIYGEKD